MPRRSFLLEVSLAILFVLVGMLGREWLLAWPNFKPVGAVCILAGLMISRAWLAVLVPLAVMGLSDLRLGGAGLGLAIGVQCGLLGQLLIFRRGKQYVWSTDRVASATRGSVFALGMVLLGAVQFFVLTNLAVWGFTGWYSSGWAGLQECVSNALPFFWRSLAGDLVFAWLPISVAVHAAAVVRVRQATACLSA